MLPTDLAEFSKAMISCFQNYRANISEEMVREWFESKLMSYPLYSIKRAFTNYVDNYKNKFPPGRGQIIHLVSGEILEENKKAFDKEIQDGCKRVVGGKRCGRGILVHELCEECYYGGKNEPTAWIDRAKAAGCNTEKEIAEWSREQLSQHVLGRQILERSARFEAQRKKERVAERNLSRGTI